MPASLRISIKEWADQTFVPLKGKLYRAIWLAGIASNLGSVVQRIVAAWFMVVLSSSPLLVTLVHSVAVLPMILFALLAGTTADIFDKRIQMIIALSFCALMAGVMWVLTVMGWMEPWSLLLTTFLLGIGIAFYLAAWQSSVYEIVRPDELSSAISLNGLSFNFARSVGPAIGAAILVMVGVAVAFLLNALTYLILILTLISWRRGRAQRDLPRETLGGAMMDGVRFVSLSPVVRRIIVRGSIFGFAGSTLLCLPPLIVVGFGMGPRALGAILTGFGLGAMIGAVYSARLRSKIGSEGSIKLSSLSIGICLLILAFSPSIWITALVMFVAGIGWVMGITTFQVAVQMSCPRWVAGRTISIFNMGYFLGLALGSITWGAISEYASVSVALIVAGLIFFITLFAAQFFPILDKPLSDFQPIPDGKYPPIPDMHMRSGPIVVTVEYRVLPEEREAFLKAITAIKLIRTRDGARKWVLTHGIDDPELWFERFHSPTWADYLHRLSRRLTGDRASFDHLYALCATEPVYRRCVELSLDRPRNKATTFVRLEEE